MDYFEGNDEMDKWQKEDVCRKIFFFVFAVALPVLVVWFIVTTLMDYCSSGLILNMIGVLLVFVFGYPQPDYDSGCCFAPEELTVIDSEGHTEREFEERNRRNKIWHKSWAILGLLYLLAGFGFQLYYQLTLNVK